MGCQKLRMMRKSWTHFQLAKILRHEFMKSNFVSRWREVWTSLNVRGNVDGWSPARLRWNFNFTLDLTYTLVLFIAFVYLGDFIWRTRVCSFVKIAFLFCSVSICPIRCVNCSVWDSIPPFFTLTLLFICTHTEWCPVSNNSVTRSHCLRYTRTVYEGLSDVERRIDKTSAMSSSLYSEDEVTLNHVKKINICRKRRLKLPPPKFFFF